MSNTNTRPYRIRWSWKLDEGHADRLDFIIDTVGFCVLFDGILADCLSTSRDGLRTKQLWDLTGCQPYFSRACVLLVRSTVSLHPFVLSTSSRIWKSQCITADFKTKRYTIRSVGHLDVRML